MIIIIDDYGTDIERENASFLITKGETKKQISPYRVTAFHVKKPCTISSPALLLAAEFQVPMLFFNNAGRVKARVWQPQFGSHARIRHGQLAFAREQAALDWVAEGIALKMEGQVGLLRWVGNRLPSQFALVQAAAATIAGLLPQVRPATLAAESLRAIEAQAARSYWEALFAALAGIEPADKRSRRPARDPLNALINYGYGMLYGEVESATLTAGLDPHIGFLHREEFGKTAFVYDAIEPFRPWVDRLVVDLVMQGHVRHTWFEEREPEPPPEGGVTPKAPALKRVYWLSREGKKAFIPAYFRMLNERTDFQRRRIRRRDQVQARLTALAQALLHGDGSLASGANPGGEG